MGGLIWVLFFSVTMFFGKIYIDEQHQLNADNISGEAAAISGNMMVYRTAVSQYARANTTVTGTVADSSLVLPTWYVHISGISNYVSGGKAYVYYSNQRSALAYKLVKDSNNSLLAGIKRSGYLFNPMNGTTTIALPSAIPDESVVYADS